MEKYTLPHLPFAYDALEPYIDEETMRVHHDGHHKGYVTKLNEILQDYPDFIQPVEKLLTSIDLLPAEIQEKVKNNAGGHANHSLFWTLMKPEGELSPKVKIAQEIHDTFGGFSEFKRKFSVMAAEHFSNGWAWLCAGGDHKLSIFSTKDHESPIAWGLTPLLVLDLWEHAYYLKVQNRRPDYIDAFWHVVNWAEVESRWIDFKKRGKTDREWRMAG